MEAIAVGDAALLAGDFSAAAVQYQQAITLEPRKALGHLRMAALHLSLGELDQATLVLETAERFNGGDARITVQTLALKAMLAERKGALADANLAWSAYALLGRAGGPALGDALTQQAVATTCAERKTAVAAALERQAASAKVRERIEKNLAEAEPSGTSGAAAPKQP
jgi:tetratricopeptide (TPR) repeat protein